jgi:PKD repeat protein
VVIKQIFICLIAIVCGLLVVQPVLAADSGAGLYPVSTTSATVPSISATAVPDHGASPLQVQFRDTSLYTLYYWYWDFGDGSQVSGSQPGLKFPVHTYNRSGTFNVTLATKNVYGMKTTPVKVAKISVTGSPGPTANFSATPLGGPAPLSVSFSDTSSGGPTSWSWDFGDGNTSALENPTHTYTQSGNFTVSLTAGNTQGNSTKTNLNFITVFGPPVAAMNVTVLNCTPFVIQCRDLSTGGPTSWLWDFGDGNHSTLQDPTYTYGSVPNGPVTVTLTAGNQYGNNTTSKSVEPECIVNYTAKITVTSTDGIFPIPGSKVYAAPYVLKCPTVGLGCSFYPDVANKTYLGMTDENGIISAPVPRGYVQLIANRTFLYEDPVCPLAGVIWNGNITHFFDGPESVTVNLTQRTDRVCVSQ